MARTTSCTPATIAGRRSRAEQFLEAAELVASGSLDVLLRLKTPAGYSHKPISSTDRKRARRAATSQVERMRTM